MMADRQRLRAFGMSSFFDNLDEDGMYSILDDGGVARADADALGSLPYPLVDSGGAMLADGGHDQACAPGGFPSLVPGSALSNMVENMENPSVQDVLASFQAREGSPPPLRFADLELSAPGPGMGTPSSS